MPRFQIFQNPTKFAVSKNFMVDVNKKYVDIHIMSREGFPYEGTFSPEVAHQLGEVLVNNTPGKKSSHKEPRWEKVTYDPRGAGHTYRLQVPGGWLYRTVTYRHPDLHNAYEACIALDSDVDKWKWKNGKNFTQLEIWKGEEILSCNVVFVAEPI